MGPNDRALWERFISKLPDAYTQVQYDVPVGSVPEHSQQSIVDGGANMSRLYKRRIDVVGYIADQRDVIELKPRAGMSAIGQVLGYKHLLERDEPFTGTTKAVIVTDHVDADVAEYASTHGVAIIVV